MSYEAGKNQLQYRCQKCGLVSPHAEPCFKCGSIDKKKEIVPIIVVSRPKGMSISIKMR